MKATGDETLLGAMRDHTLPVAKAAKLANATPEIRAAVIEAARDAAAAPPSPASPSTARDTALGAGTRAMAAAGRLAGRFRRW